MKTQAFAIISLLLSMLSWESARAVEATWEYARQLHARVPLRYSPAMHVNQEGYLSALSKKAMIGYYLGNLVAAQTIMLTLSTNTAYLLGASTGATINMAGNNIPVSSVQQVSKGLRITWASVVGHAYRVACASSSTSTNWTTISPILTASAISTSWTDTTSGASSQRSYRVYEVR